MSSSQGLFDIMGGYINEYLLEPHFQTTVGELYTDSVLESIVEYPLYEKMNPTGNLGSSSPVTIGSVAKDFAGGFLNIGSAKTGGSGLYGNQPYQAPPVRKISASASKAGRTNFSSSQADFAQNYGFTNNVKASLYKMSTSNVPEIKDLVANLQRSANRRSGVRSTLPSSNLPATRTRTPFPYSKKPKYYG